jgi:hypothetical protein
MTISRSDFDALGFNPAELDRFLLSHGVIVSLNGSAVAVSVNKDTPSWIKELSLMPHLTRDEAAAILVGFDPYSSNRISDEDHDEFRRYDSLLKRSIHAGNLKADAAEDERGNKTHHIAPQDLNAWRVRNGLPAPLPITQNPDTSLHNALAQAEAERDAARAELKDAIDWWDGTGHPADALIAKQLSELTGLRAELQESEAARQAAEELAARMGAEVEALKAAEAADPADLPDELDCALMALRAVRNGYGTESTQRKRITEWLKAHRSDLKPDAIERIATVANPDKATGRK